MSGPILRVDDLTAEIDGHRVVQGASFEVRASGVTALLGRNGVGKTSTLRAILGLIDRRGEILFGPDRIDRLDTHRVVRRGIGYVPEDREVFAGLTVAENMRLAARAGAPHRQMVEELFPDLVQRAGQRAGSLSGGQQQMLSLGRVLANDNKLLLIDEPTKGLSPRVVGEVAAALERAAHDVPMLLVEQNLEVVRRLAQQVVVMEGGRVVHTGAASDLLNDREALERYLGVRSAGGGTVTVEGAR